MITKACGFIVAAGQELGGAPVGCSGLRLTCEAAATTAARAADTEGCPGPVGPPAGRLSTFGEMAQALTVQTALCPRGCLQILTTRRLPWKERSHRDSEEKATAPSLYNLTVGVTPRHFCGTLLATANQGVRGLLGDASARRKGSLGTPLETCVHVCRNLLTSMRPCCITGWHRLLTWIRQT